jgi:hypothetical protein
MSRIRAVWLGLLLFAPAIASAEVVRVEIESREVILDGRSFGVIGPYEKIVGVIYFAFDPDNPYNARIVDLALAPRNADGRVEAWANFTVLRPVNPVPGGGVALIEVSNRGGKASLRYLNRASAGGFDPTDPEHFGDGLLMRLGLTVIWVGWQWDVPLQEGRLRLHVPVAVGEEGEPIVGMVRADWTVDRPTQVLDLAHRNHVAYPVYGPDGPRVVLTERDGRMAERRIVPRSQWRFARIEGDGVVTDPTRIYMESGFTPGKIYELVYPSKDPRVVGLGPAAIRDVISYAKYDPSSPFPVDYGIAIGISQTGRFLRHYTYQGFNTDEQGRKALDGLMIHTAGAGRGSFNHRFAQPSRDAHRYSAFFYPTDIFPFTSRTQTDWQTGRTDGLFAHAFNEEDLPKIFYTNTGYEYWGRAAALIHTSVDGESDIELYPNERIYHLASGQHFVGRYPPPDNSRLADSGAYRGNPLDFLVTMRALLVRMMEWVKEDAAPPPSAYPTIAGLSHHRRRNARATRRGQLPRSSGRRVPGRRTRGLPRRLRTALVERGHCRHRTAGPRNPLPQAGLPGRRAGQRAGRPAFRGDPRAAGHLRALESADRLSRRDRRAGRLHRHLHPTGKDRSRSTGRRRSAPKHRGALRQQGSVHGSGDAGGAVTGRTASSVGRRLRRSCGASVEPLGLAP